MRKAYGMALVLMSLLVACGGDDAGHAGDECRLEELPALAGEIGPSTCPPGALAADVAAVVGVPLTFETGALQLLNAACPDAPSSPQLVTSGDVALRHAGDAVLVLERGASGSVIELDAALRVRRQVALSNCNPHDVLPLADGRLVITCYDDTRLRVVEPLSTCAVDGPDLSALADADGLPEMDQLALVGDTLYVTLQRLEGFAVTGPGAIAALDATTLALLGSHDLPCANPFTRLLTDVAGALYVGCAGDFLSPGQGAVARFDPGSTSMQVLADATQLGGDPSALAVAGPGDVYAVVAVANPESAFETLEMRLVRLTPTAVDTLLTRPGFSLAPFVALDAAGRAYVGERSGAASAGVWRVSGGAAQGPFTLALEPWDLAFY